MRKGVKCTSMHTVRIPCCSLPQSLDTIEYTSIVVHYIKVRLCSFTGRTGYKRFANTPETLSHGFNHFVAVLPSFR